MTNCLNVLSRGSCTVPNCAHEHNILVCEPCGFIADDANAYTGHLTSNRHKTRIAGRGITLYCPVCEMNIESGTWASHKAGSNHLNQAIRKRVSPDVDPEEGANDQGQKYCQLCKRAVRNSEWARHLRGTWHLKRKDFAAYQAALNEAERDKNGISIDGKLDFGIVDFTKTKKTITRPIVLKATAANVRVRLTDSKLVSSRANMDTAFTLAPEGNNRNISSGTSVKLFVTLKQTYIGRYEDRLEMSFQDLQTKKKFFISRALRVIIGSKEGHEQLKASKPYVARSAAPKKAERKTIKGIKPPALTSIPYVKKLKPALIPKRLQDAVSNGPMAEIIGRIRSDFLPPTLNSQSLARHFKTLLWVEEHRAQQDLERYDIPDARLKKGGPFYFVEVPGLAEKRPSVLLGDRILVQPHGAPEGHWFEGYVHIVREKEVGLRFNKSFKTSQLYHVRFKLCRINFRRQHNALDENFHEDRILFPNVTHSSALSRERGASKGKSRYYDHNIATNPQQELAIRSITRLPPGSPPFVLFGPFGTGKTSTIIEAILQILKSDTEARILACAPSNAAADLIATKLSTILNNQVLFRYNAPSRSIKGISAEVLKHSHFVQADDSQPSHFGVPSDKIKRFRVIVSTCISSSFADGIGIPRGHFSHIFIDEAGQATEPETLVSIKTLADSRTNIILTGDPKQLGPVIQSPIARQLGLQISYLERLMEREVYNVENFSGVTVVKLLNNYRCHPAILKVPNEQFYNGELKAKANPEKVNKYLGSPILPNVKFPIVFHAVLGKDEKEASSPSYFNVDEALQVKQYVQMLQTAKRYHTSEKDIGIIALYHAQCLKIRKALHGIAEEIKVGSVEEFQGQERSVIIMSTVRSSEKFIEFDIRHKLGFVANPRKFNVAITRSQALLIIVGNPRVLSIDPMWRYFLNYVYNNGGWRGPVPDWDTNAEVDLSGGYDKAMHQQAQLDMNEFTRRMESLTMGGIDEDGAGVHLREE